MAELCAVATEVRFLPVPGSGIEMSETPVTAAVAAAILNQVSCHDSPRDSYRFINVVNPDNTVTTDCEGRFIPSAGKEAYPVTGITMAGANVLADRLGGRLPRLAEWLAVFTAGNETVASLAARLHPKVANYAEHWGHPTPVDNFPAQLLGFRDLLGNVGEWCDDDLGTISPTTKLW